MTKPIEVQDNRSISLEGCSPTDLANLQKIAAKSLTDLRSEQGESLWIFPPDKHLHGDEIESHCVFKLDSEKQRLTGG